MTPEMRRSPDNGIWLCCDCHTLVDKDPDRFPTEELSRWKKLAERAAFADLMGKTSPPDRREPGVVAIEEVLRRYCEDRLLEWEEACSDPDDPDKLVHYIDPHYSLLKGLHPVDGSSLRLGGDPANREDPYEPVADPEDDAITELVKLLQISPRLCITEDAGSGKSIFTRRLEAMLCSHDGQRQFFDGKPWLVVRWEQRVRRWPESFTTRGLIESLAAAMASTVDATGADVSPAAVAQWALRQGRVLLILDALDQVTDPQAVASLEESLHSGPAKTCRIVMTSRAYAVTKHATLFQDTRGWKFARIDPFDADQQQRYLSGLGLEIREEILANTAGEEDEIEPLLGIPVVLAMVRALAEAGAVRAFRTRGDLYLQVHEHFTARAARKLGLRSDGDQRVRWCEILAATACEMMVRGCYNYAVDGSFAVRDIRQGASRRCEHPISPDEWRVIESVSGLTDRCILEGATRENLCWKHRGMMEFYAGIHLARNSQPGWCNQNVDSRGQPYLRCGDADVRRCASNENWRWAWRFAIEMSPEVWQWQPDTLLASPSELFEPEHRPRPNHLIHRSWTLLDGTREDRVALPGGQHVLDRFRQEFRDLVSSNHPTAVALQDRFVRCPPEETNLDHQPFWMGTADDDAEGSPDERPLHRVRVSPFCLQSTPVTKRQFGLYDPSHESTHTRTSWGEADAFNKYAPHDDCPMINVSWWDAWVFARWIGGRLPTEAEWEYACRAGTTTEYSFGNDAKLLDDHGWFDGNIGGQSQPVGTREPNPWGLYDMHGNVWEWCSDWYGSYPAEDVSDPPGPQQGSYRVSRGGSWDFPARECRSAHRVMRVPVARYDNLGFRVGRSPSGKEPVAQAETAQTERSEARGRSEPKRKAERGAGKQATP